MQWLIDLWLELRIWALYRLWVALGWQVKHHARMCALIKLRSPRQVAKMERDKGLA